MHPFLAEQLAKERLERIRADVQRRQLLRDARARRPRWLYRALSGLIQLVILPRGTGGRR